MKPLLILRAIPLVALIVLAGCKPADEAPASSAPAAEAPAADAMPPPTVSNSTANGTQPITDTHGGAAEPTPQAQGASDDHTDVNKTISAVLGDPSAYEKAVLAFQQAVAQKDAATVASMIQFPFKTYVENRPATIRDNAEFIAKYGQIVSPQMAETITQQRYSDLFVNQKGVMFGNGQAWLNGVCKDDKCEAVDVQVVALQPGE